MAGDVCPAWPDAECPPGGTGRSEARLVRALQAGWAAARALVRPAGKNRRAEHRGLADIRDSCRSNGEKSIMAEITAAAVKTLRERTGLPMME